MPNVPYVVWVSMPVTAPGRLYRLLAGPYPIMAMASVAVVLVVVGFFATPINQFGASAKLTRPQVLVMSEYVVETDYVLVETTQEAKYIIIDGVATSVNDD